METTTRQASERDGPEKPRAQLAEIFGNREVDWPTRLLLLQGWRGEELTQARRAGFAHRLAPAFCAAGAAVTALTASAWLAAALMATAIVGVFARNHPGETIYNWLTPRIGGTAIPRNKAAKRLGCAIGTLFLAGSFLAFVFGADSLGSVIAGTFAAIAALIAVTKICVPSMIFTLIWGTERATADRLC
jgi:hypothetical protein